MEHIDIEFILSHLPPRPDDAHKGTMGSLSALSGSYGFSGAATLCAKAALRTGVGLFYQILPDSIYPIFSTSVPEAVCVPVAASMDGAVSKNAVDFILSTIKKTDALVVGCGLKNTDDTKAVVEAVLKNAGVPMVLDADGINALAGNLAVLDEAKAPVVLTPHPKEFSRLTGIETQAIQKDRFTAARDFSLSHKNTVLVLKGHRTLVAQNGVVAENRTGNSGMATGGSGDVLSGMIASFLARGADAFSAAKMGVFLHGTAGDRTAQRLSKTAMLPSDLIESLPELFLELEHTLENR